MSTAANGVRVPPQDVELYALGWRLKDEPGCGRVLMLPPSPREAAR